ELQPARSGQIIPVLRRVARHGWLVVVADLCIVAAAYGGAIVLTDFAGAPAYEVALTVVFMAGAQLVCFGLLNVYRTAWWVTEVSGFGLLLRACAAGTVAGYMGLRLLELPT